MDGGSIRLADLRGKVVFLNFWATWCPPCLEEMPSMEALNLRLEQHPDFFMLSISVDEGGVPVIQETLGGRKLQFPVALDATRGEQRLSGQTASAYGITGVPETFVIDRDGTILRHQIGPVSWAQPRELDYFQKLLGAAPGA